MRTRNRSNSAGLCCDAGVANIPVFSGALRESLTKDLFHNHNYLSPSTIVRLSVDFSDQVVTIPLPSLQDLR